MSGTTAPVAATTVQERRSSNFIARNWRGDFPLWVSYWVFGFFGNIACVLVAVAIGAAFSSENGYNPYAFLATFVLVWLGVGLILLWQSVGIWRSANRYAAVKARQGKRAPWAGLAKLAVILGALRVIAEFVSSGAPQITEASKVAFFDDPDLPPYAVRIMRDGTEVEVSGGFKYGLHEDLLRILKAAPRVQVVHLNSLGGRTGEAEKLYRTIRNRGLVTYTANQCMSACTIAFAGGRERWIQAGAELGFHAPSYPGSSERDLAQAARAHEALLVAAGFDPTFARRALSTPNKDIWTPTADELLQAHAITGVADSHRFAASGYGSDVTRDDMAGKMKRLSPILGALEQRSPKNFNQIADAYYAGYLAGESAGKLNEAANSKLLAVIQSYRPWADDQTLADLGRLIIDQFGALATRDACLCYEYASGAGGAKNFSVYLPEDLIQREAAINDRILRTAARRPSVPEQTLESYWGTVDAGLARRFGPDAVQLLLSASAQPAQYGSYCNMAIGMYQEMLKLGDPQAAALMRQIFKGM